MRGSDDRSGGQVRRQTGAEKGASSPGQQLCPPPTRAEEGCLSCDFYEQQPGRNEFLFLEEWTNRAALDAHFQTPHFQHLMKHKMELVKLPVHEVRIYEVADFEDGAINLIAESTLKAD